MRDRSSCIAYVAPARRGAQCQGNGINVISGDAQTGSWTHCTRIGLVEPLYLAFDRTKQFLYAVHVI